MTQLLARVTDSSGADEVLVHRCIPGFGLGLFLSDLNELKDIIELAILDGPVQIAQRGEPSRVLETQHLGPLSSKHAFLT